MHGRWQWFCPPSLNVQATGVELSTEANPSTRIDASPASAKSVTPRVTVVVPTYNEAENLPRLYRELTALPIERLGFVIVDDASPDGTGNIAEELAAKHEGHFEVIHHERKRGLGTAYVDGFKAALKCGSEFIVQMDADLSHPPAEVPKMLKKLESADVVVGSRYIRKGGVSEDWSIGRRMLSAFGNAGIRLLVGVRAHDATSGFKAYRRSALEQLDLDSFSAAGFGFQAQVALACQRAGLRVVEHPYVFAQRASGVSKMSTWIVLEAVIKLIPLRFKRRR